MSELPTANQAASKRDSGKTQGDKKIRPANRSEAKKLPECGSKSRMDVSVFRCWPGKCLIAGDLLAPRIRWTPFRRDGFVPFTNIGSS